MKFASRDYSKKLIERHKFSVNKMKREDNKDKETERPKVTFVSTYSHVSDKIRNIIRREWYILGDTSPMIAETHQKFERPFGLIGSGSEIKIRTRDTKNTYIRVFSLFI